jgi:RNA polymerase sigma-70 factor (ECF subfamily)
MWNSATRAASRDADQRGGRGDTDCRWSGLMAAAQRGDRLAYDRLLREITPYLRVMARREHPTADGVDEVVQDVLLSLHRVHHSYDPNRPFRQWLIAIARRRSIDLMRKRYRRATLEVAEAVARCAYESYPDPAADRIEQTRLGADRLGQAITALPALQRQAIELLKLRELSLAEASQLTGRSIGALKANTHRALKSLQKQLQAG